MKGTIRLLYIAAMKPYIIIMILWETCVSNISTAFPLLRYAPKVSYIIQQRFFCYDEPLKHLPLVFSGYYIKTSLSSISHQSSASLLRRWISETPPINYQRPFSEDGSLKHLPPWPACTNRPSPWARPSPTSPTSPRSKTRAVWRRTWSSLRQCPSSATWPSWWETPGSLCALWRQCLLQGAGTVHQGACVRCEGSACCKE